MSLIVTIGETKVAIGDTVRVSQKILEGEKERIQNFDGVVIAIKGDQGDKTIHVRRIGAAGIGVEKVFPIDLPSMASITVTKQADVRRSKLYFLRQRGGKSALLLPERRKKEVQVAKKTRMPAAAAGAAGRKRRARTPRKTGVQASRA